MEVWWFAAAIFGLLILWLVVSKVLKPWCSREVKNVKRRRNYDKLDVGGTSGADGEEALHLSEEDLELDDELTEMHVSLGNETKHVEYTSHELEQLKLLDLALQDGMDDEPNRDQNNNNNIENNNNNNSKEHDTNDNDTGANTNEETATATISQDGANTIGKDANNDAIVSAGKETIDAQQSNKNNNNDVNINISMNGNNNTDTNPNQTTTTSNNNINNKEASIPSNNISNQNQNSLGSSPSKGKTGSGKDSSPVRKTIFEESPP